MPVKIDMKLINLKLLVAAMLFLFAFQLKGQDLSKREVSNLLAKWEGNWVVSTTLNKSVWMPKKVDLKSTAEAKLILNNNYLEIDNKGHDVANKVIVSYDPVAKKFNRWQFESSGSTSFWTGKWDEARKTMKWTYIDFSQSGINGIIEERFKSDDKNKGACVIKDGDQNILLDIESIAKKVKK